MLILSALTPLAATAGRCIQDAIDTTFHHLSQVGYTADHKWTWLRYWPSYVAGSIAVASTIAALASFQFHETAKALLHGALALGALLLSGTLHIYIPSKQLEKQTIALQERAAELASEIDQLHSSELELQRINQQFGQQLERRKKESLHLEQIMRSHLLSLNKTTSSLLAREPHHQELLSLLQSIQTASQDFETRVCTCQSLREQIAKHQLNLEVTKEHIEKKLKLLETKQSALIDERHSTLAASTSLSQLLAPMQEACQRTLTSEQHLQKEVERLKQYSHDMQHSSLDLSRTVSQLRSCLRQAHDENPFRTPR